MSIQYSYSYKDDLDFKVFYTVMKLQKGFLTVVSVYTYRSVGNTCTQHNSSRDLIRR